MVRGDELSHPKVLPALGRGAGAGQTQDQLGLHHHRPQAGHHPLPGVHQGGGHLYLLLFFSLSHEMNRLQYQTLHYVSRRGAKNIY